MLYYDFAVDMTQNVVSHHSSITYGLGGHTLDVRRMYFVLYVLLLHTSTHMAYSNRGITHKRSVHLQ